MFNTITFWCEFPEKTNWKRINQLIKFQCSIYIASPSIKQFLKYKKQIKNKNIKLGIWPTLTKQEGYWFSGFSSKESINKLLEFKKYQLKLDIEAPIFQGNYSFKKYTSYFFRYFIFNKGKNNFYLKSKVLKLKKSVIISTFPFPDFLLKKIGADFKINNNLKKNFFVYTTLVPNLFKPLAKLYYKLFIKSRLKQHPETMFAIGCTGPGIFGDEPAYNNINEFEQDIKMLSELNVKNAIIFELSSLSNKPDAEEWFSLIKSNANK